MPSSSSVGTDDAAIVKPRGSGLTLKFGDSGLVNLKGGRYRIAWYAPGCTKVMIEWAPLTGRATTVPASASSGERFISLPSGTGYLNRGGVCEAGADVVIRFEAAAK